MNSGLRLLNKRYGSLKLPYRLSGSLIFYINEVKLHFLVICYLFHVICYMLSMLLCVDSVVW